MAMVKKAPAPITSDEFINMVHAIAQDGQTEIQGKLFDGKGNHDYSEVQAMANRLKDPTPPARALLTTLFVAKNEQESRALNDQTLSPNIIDKPFLNKLLKTLPAQIASCSAQEGIGSINIQGTDNISYDCIPVPRNPNKRGTEI